MNTNYKMQPTSSAFSADERAKFEAWTKYVHPEIYLTLRSDGMYQHGLLRDTWPAWQAALASQSIVPPVVQAQIDNEQLHNIVAGALFDFMGMLTSQKDVVTLSSSHEATVAVEMIRRFAEKRALHLNEADVRGWSASLTVAAPIVATVPSEPVAYQFYDEDSAKWCDFLNDEHYKNTVADGGYKIRALYAEAKIISKDAFASCSIEAFHVGTPSPMPMEAAMSMLKQGLSTAREASKSPVLRGDYEGQSTGGFGNMPAATSPTEQASDVRNAALWEAVSAIMKESDKLYAQDDYLMDAHDCADVIRELVSATPADKGNAPVETKS